MTQDEMRAKFEEWFSDTPLTIVGVLPQGDGYTKESIEWAFEAGYQAAIAEMKRILRDD